MLAQNDLEVPGGGHFGHTRYYGNQTARDYDGPNGWDWFVNQLPYVSISGGNVAIFFDPNKPFWFSKSGTTYTPLYGMLDVSLVENTVAKTLTFTQTGDGRVEVTVFNSFSATSNPGSFISRTDWRGIQSTVTSRNAAGQITELQRTYTVNSTATIESLLYTYLSSGGKLQSVTLRRKVGSGTMNNVRQVSYVYYGSGDSNGNFNDLKTATQQLPNGSAWWDVAVDYYRYYTSNTSPGFIHGLKLHFGPEAYRLMFNAGINLATAADNDIKGYADHQYTYDSSRRVTAEVSAVCPSCPGGGTTLDTFTYTPNPHAPTPGYNTWAMKTVQTLPDTSQIIVYTNYIGQPMLYVNADASGNQWRTFYLYDAASMRLLWKAHPSAVIGYDDTKDDLMYYTGGAYTYLNTTGLVEVTDYYTSTGGGGVAGYPQYRKLQQGQGTSQIQLALYTYVAKTAGSNTVYQVGSIVAYSDSTDYTKTITTSYSYTYTGVEMTQKVTSLPVVSTAQNGPGGSPPTITENFDSHGNLTSRTDERGTVNQYTYDDAIVGAVKTQTLNVVSGGTDPGMNLVSEFAYDDHGRVTVILGPAHSLMLPGGAATVNPTTWNVYLEAAKPASAPWAVNQTLTGSGYLNGSTYTLVNPYTIANSDKDGRSTDLITAARTSGSGPLTASDASVGQDHWWSWRSTQYDIQHRTVSSRVYHLIPTTSGTGSSPTNYGETDYGYDALERRNRVKAPGGTVTRTVWTTPQWVAATWVGTDDTGASDSDPSHGGVAPNNMVNVSANAYDNGFAGGDGNLTQVTQYVSATSGDTRVTNYGYDWRDRRTSMTDATSRYSIYTFDNLDRLIETDMKATSGGNLISKNQTLYDDRGRVYQRIVTAVDPTSGVTGNALTSNLWYDNGGNPLQQIDAGAGIVFTKSAYNKMGWVANRYVGYNASGTSWTQAGSVSTDIILSQSDYTYDNGGNVVLQKDYDRLNDESTTATGGLSLSTSPKARVSYTAMWYDGLDRAIASANYGASSSAPSPGSTPPASGTSVLVNLTAYDAGGRVNLTTDPAGIVTKTAPDTANRTTQTIEDYSTGTGHLNRTTNYTYTLDNLIATLTAVNATTGDQTTTYAYGTTTGTSGVARNDLLASITYPDGGGDVVSYTYNRLGQVKEITDQRGVVRDIGYDPVGRKTSDYASTIPTGVDAGIVKITWDYEPRGMVQTIKSLDGSDATVNEVQLSYNGFGQLHTEEQDHTSSGVSGTVQYDYDSGSNNEIRLNLLTYPNGRLITYDYGTSGGMSDYLNRVDAIKDTTSGTTDLAAYTYVGLGTVVQINYPGPNVMLDLYGGTPGSFAGFDSFTRIVDQSWIYNATTMLDQYKYGYDQNSNRVWKQNVVASGKNLDEYYTYDPLNRLTDMKRGTLTGTPPTGIGGTPTLEQNWALDPTGNWHGYKTYNSAGSVDLDQTRTSSTVNAITNITESTGPTWVVPGYDAAGNMTTMPQVTSPTLSYGAVYDAWNRMTQILNSGGNGAKHQYDGRGRRIVRLIYSSGTLSETRDFYFTNNGRDVEQHVNGSSSMDQQHVWGIRYINELVCRYDSLSNLFFVTQDANFNVTSLLNSSGGTVAQRFGYDPYGLVSFYNSFWGSGSNLYDWIYLFQGGRCDPVTGLSHFGLRDFHPGLGVWAQRDPSGYPDGMNSYESLRGNPSVYKDATGLDVTSSTKTDIVIYTLFPGLLLLGLGGCSKPPAAPPFKPCGSFAMSPDPSVPVTDSTQVGAAGGPRLPGYQLEYNDKNCCPNGTIELHQVIKAGKWHDAHFDGNPSKGEANGIPPQNGARPKSYVDAGNLGPAPVQGVLPQYGLRDGPMDPSGDNRTFELETCAVCVPNSGTPFNLGCLTYQFRNNDRFPIVNGSEIKSGSSTVPAQAPGSLWNSASSDWKVAGGTPPDR